LPISNGFLADLVRHRIARVETQATASRASASSGTAAGNLTGASTVLFDSIAVAMVGLVVSRHELLERLRVHTPAGIPPLMGAAAMLMGHRSAERDLGRITADADLAALAPTLIGAGTCSSPVARMPHRAPTRSTES
jgi:hypothetical protein